MEIETTIEARNYFLTHVANTGKLGTSDTRQQDRFLGYAQACVDWYWEQPWRAREATAALSFNADGVAAQPTDFMLWVKNWGWITWPQFDVSLNPAKPGDARTTLALRDRLPLQKGTPERVCTYNGQVLRYPRPSVAPEAAVAYYHRTRPKLLAEDPVVDDEWALIPAQHRHVILEGVRGMWYAAGGDARELAAQQRFKQRCADLFRSENQHDQPTHFGGLYSQRLGLRVFPGRPL